MKASYFCVLLAAATAPVFWLAPSAGMTKAKADLSCQIRTDHVSGGVQLNAVVSGKSPAGGTYRFVVTKSGRGGRSDIEQTGDFSVWPGQEAMLGEISLDVDAHDSYGAVLTLSWTGGAMSCRAGK